MPQKEKIIGRVIKVESQYIYIELDKNLKNLVKSSYFGIEYIGRINAYIIIRNASSKIVARVSKIEMSEEYKKENELHFLNDKKIITAELFGEIKLFASKNINKFYYGVSSYPLLDSPVEFISDNDLDIIFDTKENEDINKTNFKIEIGNSAVFEKYKVKMDANSFFGKHAAILGNTGSGKSCTITSILQSIFVNKNVKNGHFIIFDTNGEYKKAFSAVQNKKEEQERKITEQEKEILQRINPLYISANDSEQTLKIPHWFLNQKEFKDIFKPGEKSQEPVLNRAIAISKLLGSASSIIKFHRAVVYFTFYLIKNLLQDPSEKPFDIPKKIFGVLSRLDFVDKSSNFTLDEKNKVKENYDYIKNNIQDSKGFFISANVPILIEKSDEILNILNDQNDNFPNVDRPIFFDFQKFVDDVLPLSMLIDGSEGNLKVKEYCSTLLLRIKEKNNDPKYEFLFKNDYFDQALSIFLRFITGLLSDKKGQEGKDIISQAFLKQTTIKDKEDVPFSKDAINQVIIIDLHSLSAEIIENITAILGRLILDFLQHFEKDDRGKFPICMILEEAHRYIPESKESPAKEIFERIAKEGRKFGLGLVVSSQRPSELSKTVLSQCNSFIVHKIQNPEDLNHVKKMTPYMSEDVFRQLPVIQRQYALMFGDCVRFPVLFKVKDAFPRPKSEDSNFVSHWTDDSVEYPNFEEIAKKWEGNFKNFKVDLNIETKTTTIQTESVNTNTQESEEEIKVEDIPF